MNFACNFGPREQIPMRFRTLRSCADEYSNPTPADDVNRAILGNVAMQVAPPGGQN